jgi:hypothetical protein
MPTIWIEELGEGRALVRTVAGLAATVHPVTELREGESHEGIPYGVWLSHAGTVVDVATLERGEVVPESVSVSPTTHSAHEVARLRLRAAWIFALLAVFAGLFALSMVRMYPYVGYVPVLWLAFVFLFSILTGAWARVAWRMFRKDVPVATHSAVGWLHVALGLAMVVYALNATFLKANAEVLFSLGFFIVSGLTIAEAGRTYLKLWLAQANPEIVSSTSEPGTRS